jgi:hypothetical protein
MSSFPAITTGLTVTIDGAEQFADWLRDMGRRTSRQELLPILKGFMDPAVEEERGLVNDNSGALSASLKARAGSGDRPGVVSVFSAPTATRRQLIKKWGAGRRQQRGWAAQIEPGRGRRAVFYAPFVELGHRMVKRMASGELKVIGTVVPHPFAAPAMTALEAQGDEAADAILKHIMGED